MRTLRKIGAIAVLAAALPVLPATVASAASSAASSGTTASMALTLTGGDCEPVARRFFCSVSFTGATSPVAIRWSVNGSPIPSFDDRSFVTIGCQPTFAYDIRAVISDATGASVQFRSVPICRSGTP